MCTLRHIVHVKQESRFSPMKHVERLQRKLSCQPWWDPDHMPFSHFLAMCSPFFADLFRFFFSKEGHPNEPWMVLWVPQDPKNGARGEASVDV